MRIEFFLPLPLPSFEVESFLRSMVDPLRLLFFDPLFIEFRRETAGVAKTVAAAGSIDFMFISFTTTVSLIRRE